jgi:hypothetical protein
MANENLFFSVSGCARQEDKGAELSMEQGKVCHCMVQQQAEAGQNLGP